MDILLCKLPLHACNVWRRRRLLLLLRATHGAGNERRCDHGEDYRVCKNVSENVSENKSETVRVCSRVRSLFTGSKVASAARSHVGRRHCQRTEGRSTLLIYKL